jgi:hypothetical protein
MPFDEWTNTLPGEETALKSGTGGVIAANEGWPSQFVPVVDSL